MILRSEKRCWWVCQVKPRQRNNPKALESVELYGSRAEVQEEFDKHYSASYVLKSVNPKCS